MVKIKCLHLIKKTMKCFNLFLLDLLYLCFLLFRLNYYCYSFIYPIHSVLLFLNQYPFQVSYYSFLYLIFHSKFNLIFHYLICLCHFISFILFNLFYSYSNLQEQQLMKLNSLKLKMKEKIFIVIMMIIATIMKMEKNSMKLIVFVPNIFIKTLSM